MTATQDSSSMLNRLSVGARVSRPAADLTPAAVAAGPPARAVVVGETAATWRRLAPVPTKSEWWNQPVGSTGLWRSRQGINCRQKLGLKAAGDSKTRSTPDRAQAASRSSRAAWTGRLPLIRRDAPAPMPWSIGWRRGPPPVFADGR